MSFQGEQCPDRVADILEACGALDPGSSPGRDVLLVFPKRIITHLEG